MSLSSSSILYNICGMHSGICGIRRYIHGLPKHRFSLVSLYVIGWVSLSDAVTLRFGKRLFKGALPFLHLCEDDVGRAIQNAIKPTHFRLWHSPQ
jgi:hypothetical protein